MILKLYLDQEIDERLKHSAEAEFRPVSMQAEVLLRRALGLPVPKRDHPGQQPPPRARLMLAAPAREAQHASA